MISAVTITTIVIIVIIVTITIFITIMIMPSERPTTCAATEVWLPAPTTRLLP